ncbi:hypothetical protein [Nocardia violaceofusca]|uniref:hypothetical protein n=1 Tax=Nocardia violaceofusca TaxID=941182 RepID=UPI0012F4E988|nr:hypothetical protein [Nocardia violaceofusca]
MSFIANPLTILWNLYCRYEIGQLPPPIPGSPYQPMDPGKPLYRRPQILAVLLPFLAIAGIIAAAGSDPNTKHSSYSTTGPLSDTYPSTIRTPIPSTTFTAGQCVWNTHQLNGGQDDDNTNVQVLPCDDPRAQATVLGTLSRPAPTPGFPRRRVPPTPNPPSPFAAARIPTRTRTTPRPATPTTYKPPSSSACALNSSARARAQESSITPARRDRLRRTTVRR